MRELGSYDGPTTKDGKIYDPVAEYLEVANRVTPPKDTRTVEQYSNQKVREQAARKMIDRSNDGD